MSASRLVSIVIPAYKALFFEATLNSAMRQNHDEIEIVICDDSPTEEIADIIERKRAVCRWPIRYFRNDVRLGEIKNAARCIAEAKGHYIKFLYDDDIIVPDCVRLLVDVLEHNPDIALASSRRQFIDEKDNFCPNDLAFMFPFPQSSVLEGKTLVSFLGQYIFNFIGEPSSVMCRRADVLAFGDELMSLNGEVMYTIGDLAMYVKLLRTGNLAMIDRTLSYFRVSDIQYSQHLREDPTRAWAYHELFKRMIRESGWTRIQGYAGYAGYVNVAPLSDPLNFTSFDLLSHAVRKPVNDSGSSVKTWLEARTTPAAQRTLVDQRLSSPLAPAMLIVISDFGSGPGNLLASLESLTGNGSVFARLSVAVLSPRNNLPDSDLGDRLMWAQATPDNRALVINDLVARQSAVDWIMLVDAGTTFIASSLQAVLLGLMAAPGSHAAFADELHQQLNNAPGLVLRPDFNLDYLLSFPMVTSRHWIFRQPAFLNAGGFDPSVPQALEFDLILRLIESSGISGFAHISEPLLICSAPLSEPSPDEISTLQRHLQVRDYENSHVLQTLPRRYHIQYGHPAKPLVSILVTTKGQLNSLVRCVESIFEKTAYQQYEILIVDNNSKEADTVAWLSGIESMGSDKIKVLRYPYPFNYSAINNMAARQAKGEYLVLLDDHTAILHNTWLDELLNHAMRPEVGIVGAKLLLADGQIQHAGVILGLNGPTRNVFLHQPQSGASYMQRLEVDQNYSAVSSACLMIRASLFHEVEGLDEVQFNVSFSGVDLCLKVGASGHLIVWTPHVSLLYEPKNSDTGENEADTLRLKAEEEELYRRWLPIISSDPAYNKNFSLSGEDFSLQFNTDLNWRPLSWRPLPVVLGHPAAPWDSAANRLVKPFEALRNNLSLDGAMTPQLLSISELAQFAPDAVILQRRLDDDSLEAMRLIKAYSKAFTVYELDEYPVFANDSDGLPQRQALDALTKGLRLVDRLVVSSAALADALSSLHSDIRIVEDRLDLGWWQGHESQRRRGKKLRVGWSGDSRQSDDLQLLTDVLKTLANEVEWVFMGACPAEMSPYIYELHPEPSFDSYPAALARLNLDLALVPLKQTVSNEFRSNLMVLRYGAFGIPVICSDIRCFQDGLNVTRVKNTTADWVEAIRAHINDVDASERMGDQLHRQVMDDWMLEGKHLDHWLAAWLPG